MLFKLSDHSADAVVPKLDFSGMQTGNNPRACWMKTDALYPLALCFELYKHLVTKDK